MRAEQDVYIAYSPTHREIKVGVSVAPRFRVVELSRERRAPVHLLAVVPGGRQAEGRLLRRLNDYRVAGEWFKECPEVMLVVSEVLFCQRALNMKGDVKWARRLSRQVLA